MDEEYSKSKELGYDYLTDRREIQIDFTNIYINSLSNNKHYTYNEELFLYNCKILFKSIRETIKDHVNHFCDHEKQDDLKNFDFFYIDQGPDSECEYPLYIYFMRYETEDEFIERKENERLANEEAQRKRDEKKRKKQERLSEKEILKAGINKLSKKDKEELLKELQSK